MSPATIVSERIEEQTVPTTRPMNIVLAGGGTGGHLAPGLAVAEELAQRNPRHQVRIFGTGRPAEQAMAAQAELRLIELPAQPLRLTPRGMLRFVSGNWRARRQARQALQCERVDLVVALGGYGAFPVALAARSLGIPVIVLEQNVLPGKANRLVSRYAELVVCMFPESAKYFARSETVHWGNPIRRSVLDSIDDPDPSALGLNDHKCTLLVCGGSQGARSVNETMLGALPELNQFRDHWQVIHLTGREGAARVRQTYREHGWEHRVMEFCHNMGQVYAVASAAVARAGATTLAELCCAGIPSILLPYPHAAGDHQTKNAAVLARHEAAIHLSERPEPAENAASVTRALASLLSDPHRRARMGDRARDYARPEAASRVVDWIEQRVVK